jgi:hypothetical protein
LLIAVQVKIKLEHIKEVELHHKKESITAETRYITKKRKKKEPGQRTLPFNQ